MKGEIINKHKRILDRVAFYCLMGLLVFLPLSAWIISLSGFSEISLVRDFLVGVVFVAAFYPGFKEKRVPKFVWVILGFIGLGVLSVFWKETSLLQWVRGFRFTFTPLLLMAALSLLKFEKNELKMIYRVVLAGGIFIAFLAALEFLGVKVPLTTSLSGSGALVSEHKVGALNISRLQSVLAGPNALGLYMLALLGYSAGVFADVLKKNIDIMLGGIFFIVVVLTFSRSALLGAILICLVAIFMGLRRKYNIKKAFYIALGMVGVLILGTIVLYRVSASKDLFTHYVSSQDRVEQYQRIWRTKGEIGLLGRSLGTAGPASQYSLDGSPNYWTENIYLDTFEQLGLVGAICYLGILLYLLCLSGKRYFRGSTEKTAFLVGLGMGFSGLFLNNFTGQVGVFLLFLINGLMLADLKRSNLK